MNVFIALSAVVSLLAGSALGALALWCRIGSSHAAQFWVRRTDLDTPTGFDYKEPTFLVIVPLLSQLLLVVAGVLAVVSIDALRDLWVGPLVASVVTGETVLFVLALLVTGYRTILPLWVYPSWLRSHRAAERDSIRRRRDGLS